MAGRNDAVTILRKSVQSVLSLSILAFGLYGCQPPTNRANFTTTLSTTTTSPVNPAFANPASDVNSSESLIDLGMLTGVGTKSADGITQRRESAGTHINQFGLVVGTIMFVTDGKGIHTESQHVFVYQPGKKDIIEIDEMDICCDMLDTPEPVLVGYNKSDGAKGVYIYNKGKKEFLLGDKGVIPTVLINDGDKVTGLLGRTKAVQVGSSENGFAYANGQFAEMHSPDGVPNATIYTVAGASDGKNNYMVYNQHTTVTKTDGVINELSNRENVLLVVVSIKDGKSEPALLIPALPGLPDCVATGVNDSGQVVGYCLDNTNRDITRAQGFVYKEGKTTPLKTLGGSYSEPKRINHSGDIVGVSTTASGAKHAFLWRNGRMIDLNDYRPANSKLELVSAESINDKGQVCGAAEVDGLKHAYLLQIPK